MKLDQCRNEAKHSTLPWCLHQDKARYQKHETESLLGQDHFHVRILQDTIRMRPLPCQVTAMCTSQYRDPVHWKVSAPPWHKADSRPLTDFWIQYVTMKCIWVSHTIVHAVLTQWYATSNSSYTCTFPFCLCRLGRRIPYCKEWNSVPVTMRLFTKQDKARYSPLWRGPCQYEVRYYNHEAR